MWQVKHDEQNETIIIADDFFNKEVELCGELEVEETAPEECTEKDANDDDSLSDEEEEGDREIENVQDTASNKDSKETDREENEISQIFKKVKM